MSSSKNDGSSANLSTGGLQLSRTTKGIQNTRRSVRSIKGENANNKEGGGSSHKRSSLGEGLSRIDSKRGLGGGGGGKKPTIADDLSIDETFVSATDEQQQRQKSKEPKVPPGESPKSVLESSASGSGATASADAAASKAKLLERTEKIAAIKNKRRGGGPPRRSNTFNGSSRRGMDDLSRSEHTDRRAAPQMDDLSLSRSEHTPRKKSGSSSANKPSSVQGLYKIIDSMGNNNNEKEKETTARRLPRRSRTTDGSGMPTLERSNSSSMRGIKNLLDTKTPNMTNDSSQNADTSEKKDSSRGDAADFGTNHSRSLQGIQKLIGSMNKDKDSTAATAGGKESSSKRTEGMPRARARGGSSRRLQPDAGKKEEPVDNRRRRSSREKDDKMPTVSAGDDDEGNDYDTVATPKTASEPPPPPLKDAPPPPQRKNATRRPRNNMPNLGPGPAKPANGSHKSAPAKIPATPKQSPGGLVVDMQGAATTTPIVSSTPQQLTTPQAVTMPVMPNADFDSMATPSSVAKPPAGPPITSQAPPPPPKRNFDNAGGNARWKNRQANKLPVMPGQNAMTTPGQQPKAPVMAAISPGGIVIEVGKKRGGSKGSNSKATANIPEPMTPAGGERETMTRITTPGGGIPVPQTPAAASRSRSFRSSGNESYLETPSMHSMGDISELTPCTFAGSLYGMTPRAGETPRSQTVPRTPSLYQSPGGMISELTPGGYSVGLLGDDDYVGSDDRKGGKAPLTPGAFGMLLEESEEDGDVAAPSTPSLHSPAGVVSELTPGTYGIYSLDELDSTGSNSKTTNGNNNHAPVPSTPSLHKDAVAVNTTNLDGVDGKAPIPITPSIHSPAGIVSELSGSSSEPSYHNRGGRNPSGLSNMSGHSGVVSELTPATFGSGSAGQVVG